MKPKHRSNSTSDSVMNDPSLGVDILDSVDMEAIMAKTADVFASHGLESPFYVVDLGDVVKKHQLWTRLLPNVVPYYAVKCNDDQAILSTLAKLNVGFDCASRAEIEAVRSKGVEPDRIIYANPCKQKSHLQFAREEAVSLMTFDNEDELVKISKVFPDARLVLRILPPDESKSVIKLGLKFGVSTEDAFTLLERAKDLGLDVVGVSFHVGSGCADPSAHCAAIFEAKKVFNYAHEIGFNLSLLDLGGGYPGTWDEMKLFEECAGNISRALDLHFPPSMNVQLIAEPGRFFVSSACNMSVAIVNKEVEMVVNKDANNIHDKKTARKTFTYTLNEGVRGAFMDCAIFDEINVTPTITNSERYEGEEIYDSKLIGPSNHPSDCLNPNVKLPDLDEDERLWFKNMGAYTMVFSSNYGGEKSPKRFYVIDWMLWEEAIRLPTLSESQEKNQSENIIS